jgi:nucleotide-binding universal stress UspA family protein
MGFVTFIYALVVLVVVIAVNDTAGFLPFLDAQLPAISGLEAAREFVALNGEIAMGLAAQYYLGNIGFYVIIVGALFSMLSAANATIMAGSRVKLAMARRNHLPRGFEDLHPRFNTPYKTVLLTGGFIFVYVVVFSVIFGHPPGAEAAGQEVHVPFGLHLGIEGLAGFANFLLLSGLTIVNVAIIASRRKFPEIERPFTVPGVPWVPIVAILANIVLLLNVGLTSFLVGVFAELVGVGVWFAWKTRTPSIERIEKETPTAVAEYTSPGLAYQIVVPIANPANVDQLMRTACTLAADNDGEVLVVSVVTVPNQTPLNEGRQFADQKRAVLDRAIEFAEERDVHVSGTIRISHDTAHAILNTVHQQEADAVLVGWQGQLGRRRGFVFGSTVDVVISDAKCDVYVEKIGAGVGGEIDSILLPTAGGPHAAFARETAKIIARATGAKLHVIMVIDPGAPTAERERAERLLQEATVGTEGFTVDTELFEAEDVVDAIVTETGNHDLTIIGATREGLLQRVLFGAIPEAVGQRAQSTVIMTKRYQGVTSRLAWLFNRADNDQLTSR